MIPFVELSTQFRRIEDEIRGAIDEVLNSSQFILGKQLSAFEEEFSRYLGLQHTVGVGSGTDAIHLALRAAGVETGHEVITVANTCVPTVAGIAASGATPVLVDVSPDTLTLDPQKLEEALTEKTKAIVPVHLYGHPCDMDPIVSFCESHGLVLVEDCAQAHGAQYQGRPCGVFGTAAAFSFYPTKNLGGYGDGGAVVTADASLADRLRKLRNYGEDRRYFHSVAGVNSRLDEIQAAVLRVKLRHLDAWNEERRKRALHYALRLAQADVVGPAEAAWARHCYHLYVIRSERRDELQSFLLEEGVTTLIHYPIPIHLQEAYAGLGYGPGDFPVSEGACNEVLSLPLYPELSDEDLATVAAAVAEFD